MTAILLLIKICANVSKGGIFLLALVKAKKGSGNVELQYVPEPSPGESQVKVKVEWTGICGTDFHIYRDEYPYNVPVILGHEFSGKIVELGKNVKACKLEDKVSARTYMKTCNQCAYCLQGKDNLCLERQSIGSGANGAFAKYIIVPEKNIFVLPENIDYIEGALSEPISCCVHGVLEMTCISAGDRVLVIGPGPVGLISTKLAKISGAYVVLMGTMEDKNRSNIAKQFGADEFIFFNQLIEDKKKDIKLFFDVVLECSGTEAGINTGISLVKKGGKYTQLGLVGNYIRFPVDEMVYKELQFVGSFAHTWTAWEKTMCLLANKSIKPKGLVTHKIPLREWKKGFELFEKKEGIKILLKPE